MASCHFELAEHRREFIYLVLQISSHFAAPLIETINHLKLSKVADFIPFVKKFRFCVLPLKSAPHVTLTKF